MYGNLLWTMVKVTTDRGDLIRIVIMSWNEDLLDVDHLTHDKWVEYFKAWSRRSLFSGRAQTCRDQSNVWNSRRLSHVTLKFGTKILRSDIFAQVNLISAAPSQAETEWQEPGAREAAWKLARSVFNLKSMKEQHSSHLGKIGVCLPQIWNLRNGNLLSTLVRQCIWSANRTWVMLKWLLWRNMCSPTIA